MEKYIEIASETMQILLKHRIEFGIEEYGDENVVLWFTFGSYEYRFCYWNSKVEIQEWRVNMNSDACTTTVDSDKFISEFQRFAEYVIEPGDIVSLTRFMQLSLIAKRDLIQKIEDTMLNDPQTRITIEDFTACFDNRRTGVRKEFAILN